MMLPKRKRRHKMGLRQSTVIRCPSHLKWVRGHECCIAGKVAACGSLEVTDVAGDGILLAYPERHECCGRIEAHHVRELDRGAGMGLKPDDSSAVPLCSKAHKRLHDKGAQTFEKEWRVDLSAIASELWKRSPHRLTYERKLREGQT